MTKAAWSESRKLTTAATSLTWPVRFIAVFATRELGGTLGVAIIGSVFSSVYIAELDGSGGVFAQLPPYAQHATKDSVGAARVVAEQLGVNAGPYLTQVSDAFLSGLSVGCFVAAGVAAAGAVFASRFLPARAD